MEKTEYLNIKKDTDLLMEEFRADAVKNGVNPLSKEYREARDDIKTKLLESGGYNPSDFFAMERAYGDGSGLMEELREGKQKVETLTKRLLDRMKLKQPKQNDE